MKKLFALAVAASVMTAPSNASAQAVVVNSVSFSPGALSGSVHSSAYNNDASIGRFEFKGNFVTGGAAFDYFTYCVDLAKTVSTGNVGYTSYSVTPISALSTITAGKANALNALLTNTTSLLAGATGEAAINISAATQLAVWEIMFESQPAWSVTDASSFYVSTPGSSSSANTNALTSAQTLANTYLGNIANNSWSANNKYQLMLLSSQTQQTQVFLTPSVPEPATWAMMMLGFGAIGGALRQRRRAPAGLATA